MSKSVGLGDAVRLLGGHDSKLLTVFDATISWLMVGVAPLAQDVLGWFDHKTDLSRLTQAAVRGIYESRSGLSQHGRTDRVEAAHTIAVIAAFFDELSTVTLPTRLSKTEQIAIATRGVAMPEKFVTLAMSADRLLPAEGQSPDEFERGLRGFYQQLVTEVDEFLDGLAVTEKMSSAERGRITEALRTVADGAVRRYQDSMLDLAEFPHFESWNQNWHHRAMHARLVVAQDKLTAIEAVTEMLRDRYDGPEPDELRSRLARTYAGDLQTRPADVGSLPDNVRIPSLSELYVAPRFRVMEVTGPGQLGDDSRWETQPVRADDPWEFMGDYLRSDDAARAPLCVVGACGSGGSSMLQLICAVLPPKSFVSVRVDLKRKPELTEIADHLAEALRAATGEEPNWSSLVPQGRTIQRVVVLDSFHGYVQATGTDQADLLERVADFQRRESVRNRPVAVIITGRSAVLGRARTPDGTRAIRLEPFDEPQVREWVRGWNIVNPAAPLDAESLLTHPELTRQPLSLLVLAVHTVNGEPAESLYEHLLHSLADREVMKHQPQLHQRERVIDVDISFLGAAAFAVFNCGADWISEADLGDELARASQKPDSGLSEVSYLLARFAIRRHGDRYSFSYPAIADLLVARLTWSELRRIERADSSVTRSANPDEGLRRMLSSQLLAGRRAVVDFLADMMTELGPSASRKVKELLLRLFREVPHPARAAELRGVLVYQANLLQLMVCAPTETVHASELFSGSPDPVVKWRAQTMLWTSQLSEADSQALVGAFTVERIEEKGERDVRVGPAQDRREPGAIDPAWSSREPASPPPTSADLRRRTNFHCDPYADVLFCAAQSQLELGYAIGHDFAAALSEFTAAPSSDSWERCVTIATSASGTLQDRLRFLELLVPHLSAPGHLTSTEAADAVRRFNEATHLLLTSAVRSRLVECLLPHLDRAVDRYHVAEVLGSLLVPDLEGVHLTSGALALVRLSEYDLPRPDVRQLTSAQDFDTMVSEVRTQLPGLENRLVPLAPAPAPGDGKAG